MKNQFKFKPFDQVLVRDHESDIWRCGLFSHKTENNRYVTTHARWNQCIPYNEETAHLIGTDKPYNPPQPKEYHVIFIAENGDRHQVAYTADEFKQFIEKAVLNNEDVQNFDVRRINN